ncbi:MAG: DUF5652 family protein [Minisyncoccia bacterium]|jgi:hypothetical protein
MQGYPNFVGVPGYGWNAPAWVGWLVAVVVIWSIIWKGIALWKAAEKRSKPWFIILLLVNTIGILDIIYIYAVSKKSKGQAQV